MFSFRRRDLIAAFAALPLVSLARAAIGARAALVGRLAEIVAREYQDEASGTRMAEALRANLAAGAYTVDEAGDAFAARLTADLRAVVPDKHLAIMFGPDSAGANLSTDPVFQKKINYGVQTVSRLAGNVGLIELNFFPALSFGEAVTGRYASAMTLVKDTRALIVDIRKHMGGEPACVAYFASYFFDRTPFLINEIRYRNKASEAYRTTAEPAGPKYGERRPVFLLASADSFSGAEEFAYDLQVANRAMIVGEVTGGGANPNEAFDLGDGFLALVPNGRAVNPVTGTNWEGVGVKPDIAMPAAEALKPAQKLALEAALGLATDAAERDSIESALKELAG